MQKIREARDRVHGTLKTFDDNIKLLEQLRGVLRSIEDESALQTAAIDSEVRSVISHAEELQKYLNSLVDKQSKSKARQLAHAVASGSKEEKELANILNELAGAKTNLGLQMQIALVGLNRSIHDKERFERCLEAIFSSDPEADRQNIEQSRGNLHNSLCWVQQSRTYQTWKNAEHQGILWLKGTPGKGKTYTAIAIIKDLTENLSSCANGPTLAYFLCDQQDPSRNSAGAILRGVLWQILQKRPAMFCHVQEAYEKQGDKLFTSLDAHHQLWRILENILGDPSFCDVYFVVDALDECDEKSCEDFLRILRGRKKDKASTTKWLLTSRPDINLKLSDLLKIDLDNKDSEASVTIAVNEYIESRLKGLVLELGDCDMKLQEFILQEVKAKAEGNFRWVALAFEELHDIGSVHQPTIQHILRCMPKGLPNMYRRIWDRILTQQSQGDKLAQYSKSILGISCVAERPLHLTEIAIAASIPTDLHSDLKTLERCVSFCGSFLVVRDSIVQFSHQSGKDFLIGNTGQKGPIDIQEYHEMMFDACLDYLSDEFEDLVEECKSNYLFKVRHECNKTLRSQYPFLEYACSFWMGHGRAAALDGSILDKAYVLKLFDSNSSFRVLLCLSLNWLLKPDPTSLTHLHVAAYSGIPVLIEESIRRVQEDKDDIDPLVDCHTPLCLAAEHGHVSAARLLLNQGAGLNKGLRIPFTRAASSGSVDLVDLFLQNQSQTGQL